MTQQTNINLEAIQAAIETNELVTSDMLPDFISGFIEGYYLGIADVFYV